MWGRWLSWGWGWGWGIGVEERENQMEERESVEETVSLKVSIIINWLINPRTFM
jgi:hypothetical protein